MEENIWRENIYTIREVVYELGLPQTIEVVDGYYREDEQNSLASGDVLQLSSVLEKEFIRATPTHLEEDQRKTVFIPLSDIYSFKVYVADQNEKTTIYDSVASVIKKVPRHFVVDSEIIAYDHQDAEITISPGICLEYLKVESKRGLKCGYRGNHVYLHQCQCGRFIHIPKNKILNLEDVVKQLAFPVSVTFIEDSTSKHIYDDLDEYFGTFYLYGIDTKHYLSASSVINSTETKTRYTVASVELLLPLDSDQVMLTDVKVMNRFTEDIKSSKTPGADHNKSTNIYQNRPDNQVNMPPSHCGKSLPHVQDKTKKGKKPPAPPPRTVSVLKSDSVQEESIPNTVTYESKTLPRVSRRKLKDPSFTNLESNSGFEKNDFPVNAKKVVPPTLPPRKRPQPNLSQTPKAEENKRTCGITLKSGSKDVPISLRIVSRRDVTPEPESVTSNTEKETLDDNDDTHYMEMKDVECQFRKNQYLKEVPKLHRDSLFTVHKELRMKKPNKRSPPSFKPPPQPLPSENSDKTSFSPKPTHVVPPSVRFEREQGSVQTAGKTDFRSMTVEELVECFQDCKLPMLAEVCAQENLDGSFLNGLSNEEFSNEPFCLSPFHIKKLEQIKNGWRPQRSMMTE